MKRKLPIIIICIAAVSAFAMTMYQQALKRANNIRINEPAGKWAKKIECPGLSNFHQVSPQLYRGAQPETEEGFRELEKLGVKTVINLRSMHSDQDLLSKTKLKYVNIPSVAINVTDEEVAKFIQVMSDPDNLPAFVHCQHGSDRTGTMCAAYRIMVQGWSKQDAVTEMTQGGFGFHELWKNLIEYVNTLDTEKIKKLAESKK